MRVIFYFLAAVLLLGGNVKAISLCLSEKCIPGTSYYEIKGNGKKVESGYFTLLANPQLKINLEPSAKILDEKKQVSLSWEREEKFCELGLWEGRRNALAMGKL